MSELIYTYTKEYHFLRIKEQFFKRNRRNWNWKKISIGDYPELLFNEWNYSAFPEVHLGQLKRLGLLDE